MSNKQNITIILDFDRTLFNTNSFLDGLIDIFLSCGVDKNDFTESYKRSKPYDVKSHLDNLKINNRKKDLILKKSNIFLKQLDKYLFPETRGFINFLVKNNYRIVLVTYGTDSFQTLKIKYSGLSKLFDETHITQESKYNTYKNIINKHKDDKIYLIDDLKENTVDMINKFPNINIIKINYDNPGKSEINSNYFTVNNLKEVKNIILN
jgi:FMN phosphatase YigB (HAD superfamily)